MSQQPHLQSAFASAFDEILLKAVHAGASDIHFEPRDQALRVRARVHGHLVVLQEVLDERRATRLGEVVKRSCGFDLGRTGVPQDARFARDDLGFDFRAALVPVLGGEKVVLRLLSRHQSFDLDTYPLLTPAKADLRAALGKASGLIVVSGPTGSGKSTLLYNALGSLDRERLNIGTIEDPVEYRLEGLSQSQVERKRGGSFAGMLRAFMRADPDVILVGEVRDDETAEAALHAASTGHLVLTTVHANSAAEIGDRLEGLGVHRDLYEANLRFASAQRLAPRLCPSCRELDPEGARQAAAVFGELAVAYRAEGCEACGGTGVVGRVLLFEWLARRADGALTARGSLRADALRALNEGEIDARSACSF